jgi:hypothetical protein
MKDAAAGTLRAAHYGLEPRSFCEPFHICHCSGVRAGIACCGWAEALTPGRSLTSKAVLLTHQTGTRLNALYEGQMLMSLDSSTSERLKIALP